MHEGDALYRGHRQFRHGVASWLRQLPLRIRLSLLVALALVLVIGATTYWETRTFERVLERELHQTAQSTADAVADDFELRPVSTPDELHATLHEFIEAFPALRTVTAVTVTDSAASVLASTSSGDHSEEIDLARRAVGQPEALWEDGGTVLPRVAVPLERDGRRVGAVVVTVSLGSVAQLRTRGRLFGAGFSLAAILLSTVVIDLAARRVIHRPLAQISQTMTRAGGGDLSARAPMARLDEIGAIALGLNQMLDELEHHHVALKERVADATEELRARNEELVQDYHRILALREALARAEQMAAVGQMAANVAHQIGTPLNLISGYVQLMHEQPDADPRLKVIEEQIAKVTTIVRTLLDRSRQSSPREIVDPGELIRRVCELARPKFDATGVELAVSIPDALPPMLADPVQLELALLNIVANGLDAMPLGGTLEVKAGSLTDRLRSDPHAAHGIWVEISDTGPGIPSGVLPRIFDPWLTTKPRGAGTGLGLSITKEVIAAHGGSISAGNLPRGGAIFRIELPAVVRPANPVTALPVRVV
ncbi:MAG: ATP-binding protein [Vicinamibacterales bacterium]